MGQPAKEDSSCFRTNAHVSESRHGAPGSLPASKIGLFGGGAVLLLDGDAFARERPILVEEEIVLAGLLGDAVDLQVFEEVDAGLAGGGEIEVTVAVEVLDDELGSTTSGSIDGDGVPSEGAGLAIDLVVVDDQRIVGAGVVAGVAAIAFAGEQLGDPVAVQVDQREGVDL